MIPRYSPSDVATLFSDEHRFDTMLEVELLCAEGLASIGALPSDEVAALRARRPVIDAAFVQAVNDRELITNHDTAAFVDIVQDAIGPPEGAWIHYGLTSSDVVDTALCWQLTKAADLLLEASTGLVAALARRARELIDTPVVGRTHGMHAEPTTFGAKFSLFALAAERDRVRLERARQAIAVGKLSGAVGTYSNIDPAVEDRVCESLGLRPVPATQVIARDRHAELLWACAATGATIEHLATEVRHMARSEVGEVEEAFRPGQKGSSAMPHKRNPVLSERLCGLARVLRGYLSAGLEDVALWHERDISHSSVERVILPDAALLSCYVLRKATELVDGLVINEARARRNLDEGSLGLVYSQSVLLTLIDHGMTRDAAYRIVQRAARQAVENQTPFRGIVEADEEVTLSSEELDRAFDLDRMLAHRGRFLAALDEIGV